MNTLVIPGTVQIRLTQGFSALVDEADADLVNQYSWHPSHSGSIIYAATKMRDTLSGRRKHVSMHRLLATPPRGLIVDHVNHDGLDNRRANLRVCTYSENQANKRTNSKRGWPKGVTGVPSGWIAKISAGGKQIYLGTYSTMEAAAEVYNLAARDLFGEFALLNSPGSYGGTLDGGHGDAKVKY